MEISKKDLIKEGYGSNDINDIFKQNPQLGLIGTPQEYAKYLNTLFPSSKYKDIYYHRSKEMFDVYDFSKRKAYSSDLGKYLYLSGNKGKWEKYASMHRGTSLNSPVSTLYFKVNLINPHITKDFFGEKIEYDNNYNGEEGQMDGEEFQNYVRNTNDGIVEIRDRDDLYKKIPKYIYQMVVFDSKNYLRLGSKQDTINFQKFLGKNKYSENEIENLIKQYNPNLNTGKIFMDNFEGDVFHKAMDTKEQLDNDPNLKSKIFTILGLTNNNDEKAKRKGIEIYAKYLLAYPKGDLNGFEKFIKSNHEFLDTPSIVDAEWNQQFEGFEIKKKYLIKEGIELQDEEVTAYHATPHSFDKFSTQYMGKGEGAQAFGWGLYFTDLEDIANHYAVRLAATTFNGKPISEIDFFQKLLSEIQSDESFYDINRSTITNLEQFKKYLNYRIIYLQEKLPKITKENPDYLKNYIKDVNKEELLMDIKIYNNFKGLSNEFQNDEMFLKGLDILKQKADDAKRILYEINKKNINKDNFLNQIIDSEKRQTQSTLNYYKYILKNFDKFNLMKNIYKVTLHKGKTPEQYTWLEWDRPIKKDILDRILTQAKKEKNFNLIKNLIKNRNSYLNGEFDGEFDGEVLYRELYLSNNNILKTDKDASLFLLRAGIDGIKYPAESISRGATSDTARGFNYVVFDENAVTIEKQTQLEEMEISKKDLENQKLINQAHKDITRTKGKDYAPDVHEIQKWINNPKKLKEDAEDANFMLEITKGELEEEKKKKDDRCTRIAKRKYDVWPSAYSSAAVVRCRQGKIWKGLSEEEEESLDEKTDFSKEKSKGLHGWFERQGGSGKSKGWVDCNTCRTVDGKKKCKTCGRQEGEKRSKYPACRPTPSACSTKGKGKSWGKKSEDVLFEQSKQEIERELKLNEIKSLFQRHIGKL